MQEIGPRFTLKLRSLKKGLPAVKNLGEVAKPLEFDAFEDNKEDAIVEVAKQPDAEEEDAEMADETAPGPEQPKNKVVPPKDDEFMWQWKVRLLYWCSLACL